MIALLLKTRSFYIAGPVPLFPTFALIAHYFVGAERSAADLCTTALFGPLSLLPYSVYLTTVYALAPRLALTQTLLAAAGAWTVAAAIPLVTWMRWRPGP